MFIRRQQLSEIIAEEVRSRLRELAEADDESEGGENGKRKPGKKPKTADALDSPSPKGSTPGGPSVDPNADPDEPPGDPSSEDEDDAIDADGDAGEDPSGAVNNEVAGKVVQAVTIEPNSKVLPGAKEVVISFSDSTDALRILVTATGQVKFFWRNSIHDLP